MFLRLNFAATICRPDYKYREARLVQKLVPFCCSIAMSSLAPRYAFAAAMTWMSYDYILTLGLEIELIWMKKRTPISMLYVLLRYGGMLWAALQVVLVKMSPSIQMCDIVTGIISMTSLVIVLLLEGMMALRVHILLGKSKRILAALVIGFLTSQAITFAVLISTFARGGSIVPPAKIAISGVRYCNKTVPEPQWVYPLCAAVLLIYELMLFLLCLYHAITHIERPLCPSIRRYAGSLASIMVRQSLFYFSAVGFGIIMIAMSQNLTLQSSTAFLVINSTAEFVLFGMIGPWIVLGLRVQYKEGFGKFNISVPHGTTLRFGDNSAEDI